MSGLEIILGITIWVIIGLWISYKRDWYKGDRVWGGKDRPLPVMGNVVAMPIALLIALFREFTNSAWNNNKIT